PCGETQCWVYIVRDPAYETGRETIRHRLWLEHDTYALVKEEYGGDTGTTITEFTELNQINVEPPLVTKPLPDETSPYLASGSVVVSGPAYFPFTVLE
ncbi:MAG: hypothetical protein HYS86_05110, partial [Candidatus Chisholmbacteria bacterium]|nr:hypothetical protein [Candidatus Chisholmbacteria bacterium]